LVGQLSSRGEQAVVARLLSTVRRECGLSQQELADCLGVPQSFVSKCERAERRLDAVELRRVCAALGLSLRDFVSRLDEELAQLNDERR